MKLTDAIRMYVADMKAEGRLTSVGSERAYVDTLMLHAEDVGNRDPRATGRDDVKRTLRRWPNANTQANRRSILMSFYRWTVEEGYRPYNPVEQTRRPKKTKPNKYRMSLDECRQLMAVCETTMERRVVGLGLCAGLRRQEMRLMRGHHFRRPGFIHVSDDIAKGPKGRWLPVMADIADIVEEIRRNVADDEYVICGAVAGLAGKKMGVYRLIPAKPMSETTLYDTVKELGERAGLPEPISPHSLRHAFCDHVTRMVGLEKAQALMGHSDPSTTNAYRGDPTPEELQMAIAGATMDLPGGATPNGTPPNHPSYRHGDSNPGADPPDGAWLKDENPVVDDDAFLEELYAQIRPSVAAYVEAFA